MRSSKRGNIDHEQQIVQLTTDEVIDRYKLRAASQIGLAIPGYLGRLWCWEGWRNRDLGYGPSHVFICSFCPMRGPNEVKEQHSKGLQSEQRTSAEVHYIHSSFTVYRFC
jgi:hypothetical protein